MNKFVNWPVSWELSSRSHLRRAVVYFFHSFFGGLGSRVNERQSASVCHLSHHNHHQRQRRKFFFCRFWYRHDVSIGGWKTLSLRLQCPNWLCKRMSISYMCKCHKDMKNFYNFVSVNYIADKSVIETIAKWKNLAAPETVAQKTLLRSSSSFDKAERNWKKVSHWNAKRNRNTVNLAGCVQCRFRYVYLMQFSRVKWAHWVRETMKTAAAAAKPGGEERVKSLQTQPEARTLIL